MPSVSLSILLPLLLAFAVGTPVPGQPKRTVTLHEGRARRSFSERAALSNQSISDALVAYSARVAAKYERNAQNAKAAKARPNKRQATIDLTDDEQQGVDLEYYGTLLLGTPSQAIAFDFDTGSSDLWVPIQGSNAYNDGTQFDTSASSTYQDTGEPFSDSYVSGTTSGTVAIDTVSIGGLAVSQYFGAANQVSSDFDNSPSAGLCGLAYQAASSIGQPPLPVNLYNNGLISSPEIGVRLTAGTSSGAELTVGGIASDYSGASFQSTPVISQTTYNVQSNGITVNGRIVSKSFSTAIDTGTTLILVPTAVASAFYKSIPGSQSAGSGSYLYPCDFAGSIGFSFANIGNLNFNTQELNGGDAGNGLCYGTIQGQNVPDENGNYIGVIGDIFIKSYYTVFNFGSNYVAFAPANGNT